MVGTLGGKGHNSCCQGAESSSKGEKFNLTTVFTIMILVQTTAIFPLDYFTSLLPVFTVYSPHSQGSPFKEVSEFSSKLSMIFYLKVKAQVLKMDCRDFVIWPLSSSLTCLPLLCASTTQHFCPSFNLNKYVVISWPLHLAFVLSARNTFHLHMCMVCSRTLPVSFYKRDGSLL